MKLLIANWKMNPTAEKQAIALAKQADAEGVVVCPPFPYLSVVAKVLKKAELGAQNAYIEDEGAFTGETSPKQLKGYGVGYVIVGHSDRRRLGETNELVASKVAAVIKSSMVPILCVGETKNEHETGRTREIVERQLELGLSLIGRQVPAPKIIVTYEPVWAISGGDRDHEIDNPEEAAEVIAYLRKQLVQFPVRAMVIYGGSTKADNLVGLFSQKDIDGALVGGASLRPEFKKMIKIAQSYS